MGNAHEESYRRSLTDPEEFWSEAAEQCFWYKKWDQVLDRSAKPSCRWFVGAESNTCYNALDLHIAKGRGQQVALIYESPVTATVRTFTYNELRDEVAAFAGALVAQGVRKGDRVVIYMPMIPEAVIAMLGCARIGAIHSVVFGGFAAKELASRIDHAKPTIMVAASCGVEPNKIVPYKGLLDSAIDAAQHKPRRCIVVQRPMEHATLIPGRDIEWGAAVAAGTRAECIPVAAEDPLYVLYTSGTTGQPKGVIRDNGGHMVALKWTMKNIYDVDAGDVFWAASDVGWVVGHSYIVYGPLLKGCTTILYEGKPVGTPDAATFWRVIERHKVAAMFTAPTSFRCIKREDPNAQMTRSYDLSSLRTLFLAGERTDPDTLRWARKCLGVPVVDHWWQTETGWAIAANCVGLHRFPTRVGSVCKAVPGWDVQVLDERARQVAPGETGALVVKLPLPPGALPTLWNNDERFIESYLAEFPGYYKTADAGYIDDEGYIYVMSRTDDIINVAGHRLSTGAMEEVLAAHPDVAECAVVGATDPLKGQVPLGFLVLNAGVTRPGEDVVREVVAAVRDRIGPVAAFRTAVVVRRLPKTRSGKILRRTMKAIADNRGYDIPATIDDPAILKEIERALLKFSTHKQHGACAGQRDEDTGGRRGTTLKNSH